jgi:hypothetical protein
MLEERSSGNVIADRRGQKWPFPFSQSPAIGTAEIFLKVLDAE